MQIADDGIVSSPDDPDRYNAQLANAGKMFGSGGGMSADTMKSVSDSAQGLISAAKSGGFKMTPNGVKPMRDAIDGMMDRLQTRIKNSYLLTREPKLGSSPYASQVATHDVRGGQSAEKALLDLQQVLKDCDEALARAAGIYKETDEANEASLKRDSSDGGSIRSGSMKVD